MKMNLPNKLTCLRVLLIPVFAALMIFSVGSDSYFSLRIAAFAVFCIASFTDFLDGHIARKYNLITNFGKFMDPLADKLLVCTALILLSVEGNLPSWMVLIIIAREFIISGFRLVASDNGIVIAASYYGKFKTVSQMILCMVLIFPDLKNVVGTAVITVLMWVCIILTIVSLIDYIAKNIEVITKGGM